MQDRTYVNQHKKAPVYELGLKLFKENVIRQERIQNNLLETPLEMIRRCDSTPPFISIVKTSKARCHEQSRFDAM